MRKIRNTAFIISAALTAALALSACGKKPEQPAETPSAGQETPAPAGASGGASAAEPGLLRTAVLYDITTMDVARTTDNYMIPMNVFDRLFETRPGEEGAEVVNSLCADYQVSEDGLTYDFTLKEGVVFSNGSALTASDVQFSFERLLREAKENTDIPLEVVGGEALMKGEADSLEGFTVTDDTHFTVTLSAPNAGFLAELSAPAMSIVDAETMAEAKNFGTAPEDTIGTGPYRVTEWAANDHYTLEYNDKYWGEEPSVKKVLVRVIPDPGTQNLMFRNGELDLIDLDSLDSAIVESTYKTEYPDSIVTAPRVGETYLVLNEKNEFLKDKEVRRAIAAAVDADTIIQSIYSGNAVREHGIIPTGIWGHNDEMEGFAYDPEEAKKILADAGYTEGQVTFELSQDSAADSNTKLVYQAISQQLEAVGIKAEIKSYDHSAWLDRRIAGEMDSFVARWGMDYNDPANIMYTFFGTPENTAQRSINYPDADIMARVSAARAIVDDGERMAEYQALEKKIISEDVAWVPLYEEQHLYCMGERVQSFLPTWAGFSDFYAADVVLK
ncbi:MAG: ABC transporter substrate-binding protein [Clostridium sp.]|nr:ABC transporter substrate-binding protein [Clostridium sp.]